ncbi:MAG: hypothetical protein DHS20C20_02000 [Ardenticatenaceae bacterium]|nr:MAG: hypothetical protein DHS20C20_02000 [Ardenticatenaceae bacterium]
MNIDEMNTFSFLTNRSQPDDSDYVYQPNVRNNNEKSSLLLIVLISAITLVMLPFLIMIM